MDQIRTDVCWSGFATVGVMAGNGGAPIRAFGVVSSPHSTQVYNSKIGQGRLGYHDLLFSKWYSSYIVRGIPMA